MKRHLLPVFGVFLIFGWSWGQEGLPRQMPQRPESPPERKAETQEKPVMHAAGPMVVIIASSGNRVDLLGDRLKQVLDDANQGRPVYVEALTWQRFDIPASNYADHVGHNQAAHKLAGKIAQLKKSCPSARIVLVGFDAGAHVVLLAAGLAHPESLERIVLLGAAVSCNYKLGAALRGSYRGIDNFYSLDDQLLQIYEDGMGTADGQKSASAGRVGFSSQACPPHFSRNLRQYRWHDGYIRYGNNGDHFGWTRLPFLQRVVAPLILSSK